jgi:uncharacterized membrane protein YcjF (UPF0283 family)
MFSSGVLSDNPILEFIWYMLIIYFWFMVIMVYVQIIWDILRRENLSGWGKAGWIILLLFMPFLGALIYVIARPKNTEQDKRDREAALAAQARLQGGSAVDDLAKAQGLLEKGAITQAEFDAIKAKALA